MKEECKKGAFGPLGGCNFGAGIIIMEQCIDRYWHWFLVLHFSLLVFVVLRSRKLTGFGGHGKERKYFWT